MGVAKGAWAARPRTSARRRRPLRFSWSPLARRNPRRVHQVIKKSLETLRVSADTDCMSSSHQAATNPSLKTAFLVQKIGDRPPLPSQSYRLLDILEALHEGKEVFFRYIWTVGDLMTTEIKSLTLDHKVADGLAFLEENAVRHIPILDEEVDDKGGDSPPRRELIGIVSERDLIRIVPPHVGTLLEGETDARSEERRVGKE